MVLRNARLARVTKVMFEGRELPLKDHHIIVTMNPGYSGRTELPNNLQVRAVCVPTLQPTGQIDAIRSSEGGDCEAMVNMSKWAKASVLKTRFLSGSSIVSP